MNFSATSRKAAALQDRSLQVMSIQQRCISSYNIQSIRLSSLMMKSTPASHNSAQHRRYFSCTKVTNYNIWNINKVYFDRNSTFGASTNRWISIFSPTKRTLEKIVVKVPTMGDSITEGTIVEWTAAVGQAVKADDVIALIETDKVTIDIKADMDGVITQHFGSVDETVEVGAKLYELDTDAIASVVSAPAIEAQATTSPTPSKPAAPKINDSLLQKVGTPVSDHRSPSIKFLGKEGWEALRKGHDATKELSTAASSPATKTHAVTTIKGDINVKDPMYGRPKFTEAEMEALLTGGATMAPQVLSLSTGAKFKI